MAEIVVLYTGPIVSRKEAKELKLKRYFTGKPCIHGHIAERQTNATSCVECVRAHVVRSPYDKVKAWRLLNPHKRTEEARRYREKHREKYREIARNFYRRHAERLRPIGAERARAKRKKDPEGDRRRRANFKARKERALAEIAGRPRPSVCDLCRKNHGGIVFDHCHDSGQFRGWLCDRCNKVLGLVRDSASLLKKMASYLEKSNDKTHIGAAEPTPLERVCRAGAILSD